MIYLKERIRQICEAIAAVDTVTATADLKEQLDSIRYKDFVPSPRIASRQELQDNSLHESAHAVSALKNGETILTVVLRRDGSGYCRVSERSCLSYQESLNRIEFALAGMATDLQRGGASLVVSFDAISARMQINSLNRGALGPKITYEQVAQRAVLFVDNNWRAIRNVAIALADCGELDHYCVKLFAECES